MYFLYGTKPGVSKKLVAMFDSEQQLLAYVRWATLSEHDGTFKFEQGSALIGYQNYSYERRSSESESLPDVPHNPSPSML